MAIEIGVAVGPNVFTNSGVTVVNYNVPATGSGTITAVTFQVNEEVAGLTIIIFEEVNGNTFTARSYQVLGTKAAGVHTDVEVSLVTVEGDYIGLYYSAGKFQYGSSGGAGVYYLAGDQKECESAEFTLLGADDLMYLYGTGAGELVGGGAGMGVAEAIFAGEL